MYKTFLELSKPRITFLVIVTTYLGYYLGLRYNGYMMTEFSTLTIFFHLVLGVALSSSGSAILNQYIERDLDLKMDRTKSRPLPSGKVAPHSALFLGVFCCFSGVLYLYYFVNSVTSFVSFLTIISYLFIYTPSKLRTSWNTIIGSFPGALPPVGGWTAATGEIKSIEPIILFLILFCWQIPHFLAIAIIYSSDYARGGMKMYPTVYPESKKTSYLILFFTIALIVTTIGLYIIKLAGIYYAIGSAMIGMMFLFFSTLTIIDNTKSNARKLMIASILYLPALLLIIIIDKYFH